VLVGLAHDGPAQTYQALRQPYPLAAKPHPIPGEVSVLAVGQRRRQHLVPQGGDIKAVDDAEQVSTGRS